LLRKPGRSGLRAEICIAVSLAYQKIRIDYYDTQI
jgi:hypothetical protein